MVKQEVIHESRRLIKWSVFLVSWILSVLILGIVIFSGISGSGTLYNDTINIGYNLRPPRNQIGAFSYRRWDPNENNRPVFSVYFEDFRSENNRFGLFKTALHKIVKIQDLELNIYKYNADEIPSEATPDIHFISEDIAGDTTTLVKNIMRRLITPGNEWRINNIDLSNVTEVRINNFNYQVFHENDLLFATESKKATVSNKHSYILLKGHAKITVADVGTLESNYVKWEVQKQQFRVSGVYVLNRHGVMTTGKGICVDSQLNIMGAQSAKAERRSMGKWTEEL